MKFNTLHLSNFRPFVDERIDLDPGKDHNVTVVHGQNGSGKTTLLNAIHWVLYGEADFDTHPDRLANQGEMSKLSVGDRITVSVELNYTHDGEAFKLTRETVFERQSETDFDGEEIDSTVTLEQRTGSTYEELGNPSHRVEQALPSKLSDLFLFDGEYINKLSGVDYSGEIQTAIQNIMGLEILERSERHLGNVQSRFEDEIKAEGSSELEEFVTQKQELNEKINDIEQRIKENQNTIDTLETENTNIDSKLEKIEEVAELQSERNELEQQREELQKTLETRKQNIQSTISNRGYLPFAMDAIENTAQEIDRLREQGKIPSELANEFVTELLDENECICGRPLEEGSESYRAVSSYQSEMETEGIDQAAIRYIAHLGNIQDEHASLFDDIEGFVDKRQSLREKIDDLDEEIDELSTKIAEHDEYDPEQDESPKELEEKRRENAEKQGELKTQIKNLKESKSKRQDKLETVNEKIEAAREEREEVVLARKRMKAAEMIRADINESYQQLQQKVRTWSNNRVQETFNDIASKQYRAEITDEFELKIREEVNDTSLTVDKSRGERQIASLAFIGSLVDIARERYESDSDHEYFKGGIYPIIMDSPFGSLDNEHRREISRVIPTLADQVVVFVTDSQWEGPVAEEMDDLAERQYRLNYDDGGENGHPRTRIEIENNGGS
jgi:DNA sulfur modification protein DndD